MAHLRILYVATKPAFPPTDGGKLLMWHTLEGLARRGHHVTFVAPGKSSASPENQNPEIKNLNRRFVDCRPGRLLPSLLRSVLSDHPLSILRHTHEAVQRVVQEELADHDYDVIHAEQVQSAFNIPARRSNPPVVMRAQNVESHLWRMVARTKPVYKWMARREARKMAITESRMIQDVSATVVLTRRDGIALSGGAGMSHRRVHHIPPPFPGNLPATTAPLPGNPSIFLLGGGWLPNRDSISWFIDSIWQTVTDRLPDARAHVYGEDRRVGISSISWHPSPVASSDFFHHSSTLVVPLRVASGIRMKILEAWAREIPVVATPEAVEGLDAQDGVEVLLAGNGEGFASALWRLQTESGLRENLIEGGRRILARNHDPDRTSKQLEQVYLEAIEASGPDRRTVLSA